MVEERTLDDLIGTVESMDLQRSAKGRNEKPVIQGKTQIKFMPKANKQFYAFTDVK